MSQGQALTDEDRQPWLQALHGVLREWVKQHVGGVLVCSALRRSYRTALVRPDLSERIVFVHLTGSREVIAERMHLRSGHFMPVSLLDSQLRTLEPPDPDERVITCNITSSVKEIVDSVIKKIVPCTNTDIVSNRR